MIDYPDFAIAADAEHDLVQVRIVVDRVHVVPERGDLLGRGVRIDQYGMSGGAAVVGF